MHDRAVAVEDWSVSTRPHGEPIAIEGVHVKVFWQLLVGKAATPLLAIGDNTTT